MIDQRRFLLVEVRRLLAPLLPERRLPAATLVHHRVEAKVGDLLADAAVMPLPDREPGAPADLEPCPMEA